MIHNSELSQILDYLLDIVFAIEISQNEPVIYIQYINEIGRKRFGDITSIHYRENDQQSHIFRTRS